MNTKIIPAFIAIGFSFASMPLVALAQVDPPYKNCTETHKEGVYNNQEGRSWVRVETRSRRRWHRPRTQASLDEGYDKSPSVRELPEGLDRTVPPPLSRYLL